MANVPSYNATFDFAIDRLHAIFHTRLRLDTCALNYYLFKMGCKESPACFCGFYNESDESVIFFLNVHFILPQELTCSPLLFAYLLTGGLLCPKHKLNQFFCLDQSYFLRSKIVIYFFLSSLLYLIPRDFINVLRVSVYYKWNRIQNVDGTLIQTAEMTKMKWNGRKN